MVSEKNYLIDALNGVRNMACNAMENLFAFMLPLFGLSLLGGGIRWVADQLDRHTSPWVALVFIVVCALLWLGMLSLVTPASVRDADGRIRSAFVFGFTVAAAMVWVYIFAVFSYLLLKLGAVDFLIAAHPDAPLSDLLDAFMWYFLDLIPVLHVNEALEWSVDVELNGGWSGVILLFFRIVIVFQVFTLAKRLLKAGKKASTTSCE